MEMSSKKFCKLLSERGMNKYGLQCVLEINSSSVAKFTKNENVQIKLLSRICCALECGISDMREFGWASVVSAKFSVTQNKPLEE